MSIESQLKREFASFKQNTVMPEQLETRLAASFGQTYRPEKKRRAIGQLRGTARIAVILCGIMLFGGAVYGAERLWAVTYGTTGIHVNVNSKYNEPEAFGKQTRQVIEDIQSQLSVNESAMLYVSEPSGGYNMLMVNRPQLFTDIKSWKESVEPVTGKLAIPDVLPEGYHFARGMSDSLIGITDNSWLKKYTNVLTKRLKPGEHYAWIKSFNVPNQLAGTVSPQLVYEGSKGGQDSIIVTYSPSGPDAQIRFDVTAATKVEEFKVNFTDALYVVNQQSYEMSSTGYYACIRWIELRKDKEKNILHEVRTESRGISKETLLQFAEGLR
ncbi:hypothetical protein [Paenibacillus sp. MMS20-IR301]|uniref:hypothetical protein n=1 Tax=Paenibacillus sp. MMS20-IR301 TaxID=2895946 RepID=UPI0028E50D38|nr:hypothetical protein [Paenibacillus sp. MMS20-IR301]WNS45862.1 hypothetical protein LOS79_11505 [Paenibacillus sp. MMS20-IR301]